MDFVDRSITAIDRGRPWGIYRPGGELWRVICLVMAGVWVGKPGRWIDLARPLFDSRTIPGMAWVPSAELLVFVVIWKVFTEMLRPVSGEPVAGLETTAGGSIRALNHTITAPISQLDANIPFNINTWGF